MNQEIITSGKIKCNILYGQEAIEWKKSHMNEYQRLHDYNYGVTISSLPHMEILENEEL